MDDVNINYAPLIKNILLQTEFSLSVFDKLAINGNTNSTLLVKFEEPYLEVEHYLTGKEDLYDDEDVAHIIYDSSDSQDIIRTWAYGSFDLERQSVLSQIEKSLTNAFERYNVEILIIDCEYMSAKRTDTGLTLVKLQVRVYKPRFVLPEPEETEGGYETWMM